MDELRKEFYYVIGLLLIYAGTSLTKFIKARILEKKAKKKRSIEFNLQLANKIDDLLVELRTETDADRAYLVQFHNGEVTAANIHLCKFSITQEKVAEGISHEKKSVQALRIEDHLIPLKDLIANSNLLVSDIGLVEHSPFKQLMAIKGVKSFAFSLIRDKNNLATGFIAIDFVTDWAAVDDSVDRVMKYYAQRMGYLMATA